jgi:hypothetical protein
VDGWSTPRPGRFTPGKETRYPLCRRLGGPQDRSGLQRKISPPQGFYPRTVQPVVSLYTDVPVKSVLDNLIWQHRASDKDGVSGNRPALLPATFKVISK